MSPYKLLKTVKKSSALHMNIPVYIAGHLSSLHMRLPAVHLCIECIWILDVQRHSDFYTAD